MPTRRLLFAISLLLPTLTLAANPPQPKPLPYPKPFPSNTPLPDPLTFSDGHKVSSPSDWPARRTELLDLFQSVEYGHLPPPPNNTTAAPLITHTTKLGTDPKGATHSQYKITCTLADSPEKLSFTLDLLTPKGPGPFPVLLTGDTCWGMTPDDITAAVLSRGYALAQFNRCELAPDSADQSHTGLHPLYPHADFGCLAAWAWGYHRAVDALLTLPQIDKSKIAITGHSRGGKCVLLAGALDDRVALVNPNASGCGGTGSFRDTPPDAESLKAITTKFPFWFTPKFHDFSDRETDLPFDQHELKACVAPRALLDTAGLNDVWANPRSAYRTHLAAKKVFDFLGVPSHIAYHIRPGPHQHNLQDWTALLNYADEIFFQKPSHTDWNANPFQ